MAIEGLARTDFINATGDVFSEDGGYVFVYGNGANLLVYKIANGAIVSTTTVNVAGAGGGNYVIAGDDNTQIAHHRTTEKGWVLMKENAATVIENMEGFKYTTLGGDIITLAGKEFYIYPAGTTNYSSEFSVRNMTDGAMVVDKADASKTIFFANDATKTPGATSTANWLIATPIDANNAYIHLYNAADGVALFKLSVSISATVTVACDETMGTVTGGGDVAVGANATVVATPKPGYEFVAWKNGEETVSTDATYNFTVTEAVALTAVFEAKANVTITLAVNDATMGSITLPDGIVVGENSVVYGTPLTLTAVPAEGVSFTGWFKGEELYSTDLTISLDGKESISLTANFVNVLTITYELNGGVTNDYGWTSKGHLMLDIQNDYNTKYGASLAVVKEENGIYYFMIRDSWVPEANAVGEDALVSGFFQNKTWSADQKCANLFLNNEKYQFLVDLIDHFMGSAAEARGTDSLKNMTLTVADAYFRADVSGFMLNSPATTGYPYVCNWVVNGLPDAYVPVWKHTFANPTEIKTGVTLNAPYKEGSTFDGWYATEDFSGDKITYVDPETVIPGGKLYAKWIEYIPTIAEFNELATGTKSKVKGTVSKVIGNNFWIQDATGGLLCYGKNHGLAAGELAILSGDVALYGGVIELNNATVVSHEAGTAITPEKVTIDAILADTLKYMSKLVKLDGVLIDRDGSNIYLKSGDAKILCYKLTLDETQFPTNTKVSATPVVGMYNGTMQFRANTEDVELATAAGKDPYHYPARLAEDDFAGYTLENDWLISQKLDNYGDNVPGVDGGTLRSMVEKDGKMYFLNRTDNGGYFVVVDGKNGAMEPERLNITGEHLFQKEVTDEEGTSWKAAVTLAFNHVTKDSEGNILVGSCSMNTNRMMIYVVDEKTGVATELINEDIYANEDMDSLTWRIDAFGAWGDVKAHAVIVAASASGNFNAFRWEINDGVAEMAELIEIIPSETEDFKTYLVDAKEGTPLANAGISPTALPLDEEYFLIDGQATYPTLISRDGDVVDDFKNNHTGILKVGKMIDFPCLIFFVLRI